ncbi:MAG: hypothetical protein ABIQ88_19660 [Chitinophagaceae bacterium]
MKNVFKGRTQFQIILSSIAGTTLMTFYSYIVSWTKDKNFKEPRLLGTLAQRITGMPERDKWTAGWHIHYLTGLLFAEIYAPFWSDDIHSCNSKTGLILGGLSGVAAILIWKFTLEMHPFPPAVNFNRFAGVLFIAHVIFGLSAGLTYSLTRKKAGVNVAA